MNNKIYLLGCMVFATTAYAQSSFVITSGALVSTSGVSQITLNNAKLVNQGTLSDAVGTLSFTGEASEANTTIEGTGTTSLNNLIVNKSANGVQLNKNVAISNTLTLTSGTVNLNNGNIDLGSTGSVQNETETNRIFGTGGAMVASANLNAPTNVNPANLGFLITSEANLGETTVTRSHSEVTVDGASITRNYTVTPTNNNELNATVVFEYLDSELNGNEESNLFLYQSTDGGLSWQQTASSIDENANTLTLTGLNSLGKFTADEMSPVLSVPTFNTSDTFSLYRIKNSIVVSSSLSLKEVTVFTLTGQQIYQLENINQTTQTIYLEGQATQCYIVKTVFKNGSQITKKIIL